MLMTQAHPEYSKSSTLEIWRSAGILNSKSLGPIMSKNRKVDLREIDRNMLPELKQVVSQTKASGYEKFSPEMKGYASSLSKKRPRKIKVGQHEKMALIIFTLYSFV